jgi:hypothetical protein
MGDTQTGGATVAGLKARLGEVFDEIFALGRQAGRDEGYQAARDEGYKAGLAEGARIERERVQAAIAQPLPGHEARTAAPAAAARTASPPATPKAKAVQEAQEAKKAKPSGFLSKVMGVTGRQPLPAAKDEGVQRAVGPGPSIEERCRAEWEREPRLQSEFGTLEAYTAFTRQREAGMLGG